MDRLQNTFKYGYVIGLFSSVTGDSDDPDDLPDIMAPQLDITLT